MSNSILSVSFSNEAGPSTSPLNSSPSRQGRLTPTSLSGREGIIPLGAAKTVAALTSRRGVIFSPSNDTKYFHQTDSILPIKPPPASIRAYPDPESSDPVNESSPAPSFRSDKLQSARGILKQRLHAIFLAASVEEGTLNNKEEARLVVSGKRPRLVARDSFQLAAMRTAASEGLDKGKGKALPDDNPASDDSEASDNNPVNGDGMDGSSEVEEEVEECGPLATSSLVDIISGGAEDLLTLEEAYNVLVTNLKTRLPSGDIPDDMQEEIELAVSPIRDAAPRLVCALQRDLRRLLGKVPNSEVPAQEADSSPFRGLMPMRDTARRLTPSPTPLPASKRLSPAGEPTRKGYSEAEVRYRRESAGVGAATLRFLAVLFNVQPLYSGFSDADLTSLLDMVMTILRTPSLPTPNPKRTFYNALTILAHIQIPSTCITPIKDKLARSLESALTDGLGTPNANNSAKDSTGQLRKEAFLAVTNVYLHYPSIFFPHFSELLTPCIRTLSSPSAVIRNRAGAALAAFASAKKAVLADTSNKENWVKNQNLVQRLEQFVISHLKSAVRLPTRTTLVPTIGEKRTEWMELERTLKETVGTANEVSWACATWSLLVYLMGSSYASSGLAPAFDHIMDRSLGPSTNTVRPLLARLAWSHAIYAYLSTGSMSSLSEEGIITSYNPFPHAASGDWSERVKTIHLPFEHAMTLALDTTSVPRAIVNSKWVWSRAEKSKKLQWMITTGGSASAIVYAYAGIALHHQEQPAKEMTAISGLPSSDGVPETDNDIEQAKLERIDKAWDRVVRPIVKSLWSIRGVDELKSEGCRILAALLASTRAAKPVWSLDKLLSSEYLDGSAFADGFLDSADLESIWAEEVPALGDKWIVYRLDDLLDLFQELLTGIGGFTRAEGKWILAPDGTSLLPQSISTVWSSLLRAVSKTPKDSPDYTRSLWSVTRHLIQIFNRDPATYVPISKLSLDGPTVENPNVLRLGVFGHLVSTAINMLGRDAVGSTRLQQPAKAVAVDEVVLNMAFGADVEKRVTMAGCLLGQILRTKSLELPLDPKAGLTDLIAVLLEVGAAAGFSGRLLGDMTNHMPFLFQEDEALRLAIWRQLALQWVESIDTQPSSTSSTNHTGVLLVSLLSCPFRAGFITSAWHQHATTDDLAAWRSLLETTVLRFKSRQVGANFGVLESLAGHLRDFLGTDTKTTSSTITLSCLATAVSHLSFVAPEASDAQHFSINKNYLPVDFLSLVSDALCDSYPRPESLEAGAPAISTAVFELLVIVKQAILELPLEFVWPVIEAIKEGLVIWMMDDSRVVIEDAFANMLDDVYMTILAGLLESVQEGHLSATAETMDSLLDLFGPRLSRAKSNRALQAFKEFYQGTFALVRAEEMSEQVRSFMEDLCAAVPGLITVPGLVINDTFSIAESQEKYPFSESMRSVPKLEEVLVDATEMDIEIDLSTEVGETTEEYYADVSQSQSSSKTIVPATTDKPSRIARPALSPILSEGNLMSDPVADDSEGEFVPMEEAAKDQQPAVESGEGDVFGPTSQNIVKGKRGRKSRKRLSKTRPLGESESQPEIKRARHVVEPDSSHSLPLTPVVRLVPESSDAIDQDDDDEIDDCIHVVNSPVAPGRRDARKVIDFTQSPPPQIASQIANRTSFVASAKALLSRVPSLWSPTAPLHSFGQATEAEQQKGYAAAVVLTPRKISREGSRRSLDSTTSTSDPRSRESSVSAGNRRKTRRRDRSAKSASLGIIPKEEVQSQDVPEPEMMDDEDELLLSPESARKRRREEEAENASIASRVGTPAPSRQLSRRQTRSLARAITPINIPVQAEGPSGQFDDAEELQRQNAVAVMPAVVPPTPIQRSAKHVRLIRQMAQAANNLDTLNTLDIEGVLAISRHADQVKAAVQAYLEKKVNDERIAKRAKRS